MAQGRLLEIYYSQKLSAHRLRRCYELAPPRVQQYLEAEIDFVLACLPPSAVVLELGCGYGRVLRMLVAKAKTVVGIDTSLNSLALARETLRESAFCWLAAMDAVALGFRDGCFDLVICIQNGISAFQVDRRKLVAEAGRVTRSGGKILFSSYAERFWEDRLHWFRIQAKYGLLGEIDEAATGEGVIVCHDGFRATTTGPEEFIALVSGSSLSTKVTEVDGSSIFYELGIN